MGAPGADERGQPAGAGELVVVDESQEAGTAGLVESAVAGGGDPGNGLMRVMGADLVGPRLLGDSGADCPGGLSRARVRVVVDDDDPRPVDPGLLIGEDGAGLVDELGQELGEPLIAPEGRHGDDQ